MHFDFAQCKQKGFAPILIVILIALAVGGYLIYQNQTRPTVVPQQITQPSPSPDETANWKTYTDNYVSFKYPNEWNASGAVIISSLPKIKLIIVPKDGTLMNECMQLMSEEVKNGLTLKKFAGVATGAMCGSSDPSSREIWVVPSKNVYSPGISYAYIATESQQAENLFDQILSTFKFTQ